LAFQSLAANMGFEFSQTVSGFIRGLAPLGPSPLKAL